MSLTELAFAKLNLCLDVAERRADGFHEVRSIMQSTDFCDEVTLEPGTGGWTVESDLSYLPTGETNLAARAAVLYRQETGAGPDGGRIRLKKRIPVCGGFGGGSSDAAAVLRIMNRLSPSPLRWDELEALSRPLGSDVPFCVRGGTARAEGRGEVLTPLPDFAGRELLLCRPDFSCSTPLLFKALDRLKLRVRPDTAGLERAAAVGDTVGVARRLFNVFEEVLPKKQRDTVWELRDAMVEAGALGAAMTGSGSGVFGVFPDGETAAAALIALRDKGIRCDRAKTTGRLV